MLDVFVICIAFGLTFWSNNRIAKRQGLLHEEWYKKNLNNLLAYHTVFTFLTLLVPGDALGYWNFGFQQIIVHSDKMNDYLGFGTLFLLWLDFIPARMMGLSFLTGNLLYGLLGFIGLRFLFLLFVGSLKMNVKVAGLTIIPYLFYLPNLNFWTALLGKDTLCFFGIAWFLYSMVHFRKMFLQLIVAVTLVYFIRPHVALMLGLGTVLTAIFSREMKVVYKVFLLALAVAGFTLVYQKVAIYLMVQDLSAGSLSTLAKNKAAILGGTTSGSSVDITQYSIPLRIFTYLYRPLFFDIHNAITFLSCLENLLYIYITAIGVWSFRWKYFSELNFWLKAGFFTMVAMTIVFANSLGNLGIIMREKNMTMIYLIMVCLWSYAKRRSEVIQQQMTPIYNVTS